ncbi:MAG: BUG/TctC family periplasmic protein, partial [uncultured Acetobacteraceae bacterium]
ATPSPPARRRARLAVPGAGTNRRVGALAPAALRRALPGRRRHGRRGAHPGGAADGEPRPARGGGEPHGVQRQHRHGERGPQPARRAQPAHGHQRRADGEPAPLRQPRFRPGAGLGAGLARLHHGQRADREPQRGGADGGGVPGPRAVAAGGVQLRLGRRRLLHPHGGGAVPLGRGHPGAARALPRQRPGAERHRGGQRAVHGGPAPLLHRAGAGGPRAGAGRHRAAPLAAAARRADGGRGRAARRREHLLGRGAGAGRHAGRGDRAPGRGGAGSGGDPGGQGTDGAGRGGRGGVLPGGTRGADAAGRGALGQGGEGGAHLRRV